MPRGRALRILSYDISSDRRRRRVAARLEDVGTRVQFSVFEARLTDAQLDALVEVLTDEMDPTDSLRIYTVGATAERHCRVEGATLPVDFGGNYWLV